MVEERRRRRWVLPVLLLAGAGTVVVLRARTRPAADGPVARPLTGVPRDDEHLLNGAGPDTASPAPPVGLDTPPARAADPAPAVAAPSAAPAVAAPAAAPAGPASRPDDGTGPFGAGSARPRPDGSAPGPEFTIKGNAQSKLFHPPTSPYYGRTRAEVWFRTAEDAEAAGFRAYRSRSRS